MSRSIVTCLGDLRSSDGGHILVICWCKRETAYEVADVREYFRSRRWSDDWSQLPRRFRCAPGTPWGCGRKAKRVIFASGPPTLPVGKMPEVKR